MIAAESLLGEGEGPQLRGSRRSPTGLAAPGRIGRFLE